MDSLDQVSLLLVTFACSVLKLHVQQCSRMRYVPLLLTSLTLPVVQRACAPQALAPPETPRRQRPPWSSGFHTSRSPPLLLLVLLTSKLYQVDGCSGNASGCKCLINF